MFVGHENIIMHHVSIFQSIDCRFYEKGDGDIFLIKSLDFMNVVVNLI